MLKGLSSAERCFPRSRSLLCERAPMLRMPGPIHPDLPCLFVCAIVPAFCQVKVKVYSSGGKKKPYAEAVGQTGAQGLVRGCGPHCPPVSRKDPARDEASGAPRAGWGSASFSGLISGVQVLSLLSQRGGPGSGDKNTNGHRQGTINFKKHPQIIYTKKEAARRPGLNHWLGRCAS